MTQLIAIHLHGAAKRKFGGPFHMQVRDAAEAVAALGRQLKEFVPFVSAAQWRIIRGPHACAIAEGRDCDETEVRASLGRATELHFVPVPAGAGIGSSIGKIVAGVAIVAASFYFGAAAGGLSASLPGLAGAAGFTYSSAAFLGAGIALAGISQVVAKNPKASMAQDREDGSNRTSYLYNGPVNLAEQGNPIPLVYGLDVLCGSIVGGFSLTTEQVPVP